MKWEYNIIFGFPNADDLNAFGKEGWELVSAVSYQGRMGIEFKLYFKRPKNEQQNSESESKEDRGGHRSV